MPQPDGTLARLFATFPRAGRVVWLGVRASRLVPPEIVDEVTAIDGG